MRSSMSFRAKRELLLQIAPRYLVATRPEKTSILDEFVAATGYSRKYAVRLLSMPVKPAASIKRPRERQYGPEVQEALASSWAAANFICTKRLVPFLPELVESLERHGHLALDEDVRVQLLRMSASTADRILAPLRRANQVRGKSTTKAAARTRRTISASSSRRTVPSCAGWSATTDSKGLLPIAS